MSTNLNEADDEVCASCGIKGGDGTMLKRCVACKLVRYCSVACQKEHRPQHKRECKRRAAELRDELLFKQPEISHLGECPICFLPVPLDSSTFSQHVCCSQIVCNGCSYANAMRENEELIRQKCPFCRTPIPETAADLEKHLMKRFAANDQLAFFQMGQKHQKERKYSSAFELYTKAAELGNFEAHYKLATLYMEEEDLERDEKKGVHHFEEAAIGGHPEARHRLGFYEGKRERVERATKHFMIAAKLGYNPSMEKLKEGFKLDFVKKEDLDSALRAHKTAVDATKSSLREAAEERYRIFHW